MRARALSALMCCAVLVLAFVPATEAAVRVGWHQTLAKEFRSVAAAPDGSVYAVGSKRVSITVEAILVKFAPDGTRLWTRSWLPDPHASTNGVAVDVAPSGRVVWVGGVQGQCEGGGYFVQVQGPGGRNIHRSVTSGWECGLAEAVTDVAAGNGSIVVSGYHHGCCGDVMQDAWIAGFDGTAHKHWKTNIEPPATPNGWYDRATGVVIGGLGNIYTSGWGAAKYIKDDRSRVAGTMVLWKLSSGGRVLWAKRVPHVPMPSLEAPVTLAVRASLLMVAAGVRGARVEWGGSNAGTEGWLGRFTTGGGMVWSRTFEDQKPHAAESAGVAIDVSNATWVVGTRRDVADHGLDVFVRRYSAGGALMGGATLDAGVRFVHGTGVAAGRNRAFVTGYSGPSQFGSKHGRIWRFNV
jgi:hypothetical protein